MASRKRRKGLTVGSVAIDSELHDFMTVLTGAETVGAVWDKTVDFMHGLGADRLHLSMDMDEAVPTLLWTTPRWAAELYVAEVHPHSDPILEHCRKSFTPCFGGEAFIDRYTEPPKIFREFLGEMSSVQWRSAGVFPMRCAESGDWGRFSFGTERNADDFTELYGEHGQTARLVGTHAFNKIRTLMKRDRAEKVGLTEAERQCLVWLASGLFTQEIGERLGIGAMIAARHLESARLKLGAQTADEALVEAFRLGLITQREVS